MDGFWKGDGLPTNDGLDSVRGLETIRNLISVQHVSHAGMEKQTKPTVTLSIQYGVHTHDGSNNQYG